MLPMRHRSTLATILAACALPAAAETTITILHLNDFHSRIEPINRFNATCAPEQDEAGECFGGVARIATALAERRAAAEAEGRPTLFLDAGDQFQGSLFYTTYGGLAEAEFLNLFGLDAMVVGNHEFDGGPAQLAAFLDAVEFPVIGGNVDVAAEPLLVGRLAPYVILDVAETRVAILGALTPDTATIASPGPNVRFRDPIAHLTAAVEEVRAQGVNKIIALTHVGLNDDIAIAEAVPGLDLIVGGHSHSLLSNTAENAAGPYPLFVDGPDGRPVPIVSAYAYGKFLGEVTLTFDDEGDVTSAVGEPILLDAAFAPDPDVAARVAELAEPIEALKAQVIGETVAPVDGDRTSCRARECEMGVLVSEAILAAAPEADIAITNGGGLRASFAAGPITMGDVMTVLPFQNTVATFELTGAGVLAALENGVSQVEDGAGRFPQVAGMRFTWDPAAEPGARIVLAELETADGWAALDPERVYRLASNDFMRRGGDGYAVFAEQARNAYDFGPGLDAALARFIADNTPYQPRLAGRIAEVSAVAAYTVRRGDNLWTIARRELGDPTRWSEIAEANGLEAPYRLDVGDALTLPR
ncbi:MAG: LysM peptidoglycan-binding domain-containing protein [Rhodobacteraceae bacterium]|nr:MAG: LysM peptidoglycan-binding domain-containing protein [Paracoccaceae bacterium]